MSDTPEYAVEVENVSKKFARSLKLSMIYGLQDVMRIGMVPKPFRSSGYEARLRDDQAAMDEERMTNDEGRKTIDDGQKAMDDRQGAEGSPIAHGPSSIAHRPQPVDLPPLRPSEFWALQDVSFRLKPGESLGLLGANGAGKSTLFSILSGIYAPTLGRTVVRGRLQALIALGAGFHKALSGRENIYINAAILGLSGKQVDALLDRIIAFADIGDFIEAPIKNYSSGMLVRLAFSVAAHLDPDVLLIDEILAVGDAAFQLKCSRFAQELVRNGKTMIVVSHNMHFIQSMANRCIWLDHGQVLADGRADDVSRQYGQYMMKKSDAGKRIEALPSSARYPCVIEKATWTDHAGNDIRQDCVSGPVSLRIEFSSEEAMQHARIWVQIEAVGCELPVVGAIMSEDGHQLAFEKGLNIIKVDFDNLPLRETLQYRLIVRLGHGVGAGLAPPYVSDPFVGGDESRICLNGLGEATRVSGLRESLITVRYRWNPVLGCALRADPY